MIVPTEDAEQARIFEWAFWAKGTMPELDMLYAVPNGGYRSKATAGRMKATGTKAGVPDMCLPVPRGRYHGLYIELKRQKGGTVSPAQKMWILKLSEQGYLAKVCHGADEAIDLIKAYLDDVWRGKKDEQKPEADEDK